MYVLTVIHPPTDGAAYGKAVVLDPVPYHATAAKRQARYVLETEGGASRDESGEFGIKLVLAENGRLITHEPSGLAFRIDPLDQAPHPCPCCGRLVLPSDLEGALCAGCYTFDNTEQCLPENTAHPADQEG